MILQTSTTYYCGVCGYSIDNTDPYGEYYTTQFTVQTVSGIAIKGVPAGKCASCFVRGESNEMSIQLDKDKMSTHETLEAEDIDALTEVEKDADDRPVYMPEPSGAMKYKLDQNTGEIVPVAVMVEKNRELTKQEKAEKLDTANRKVDEIAKKEYVA